jgi:hypothetical protein
LWFCFGAWPTRQPFFNTIPGLAYLIPDLLRPAFPPPQAATNRSLDRLEV